MIVFEFENGMLKKATYDLRSVEVSAGEDPVDDMLWTLRSVVLDSKTKREYAYGYFFRSEEESVTVELVGRIP